MLCVLACMCVCVQLSKSNYGGSDLNVPAGSFSYQRRPVMFRNLINVFSEGHVQRAGT